MDGVVDVVVAGLAQVPVAGRPGVRGLDGYIGVAVGIERAVVAGTDAIVGLQVGSGIKERTVAIEDASTAGKIMRLMDALDDCDDVTNTHVNFDIPEEFLST